MLASTIAICHDDSTLFAIAVAFDFFSASYPPVKHPFAVTGKLRRGVIAERYGPLVDAMYAGRAEVRVDDEAAEGGDAGTVAVDVKIRDAKLAGPALARRAA